MVLITEMTIDFYTITPHDESLSGHSQKGYLYAQVSVSQTNKPIYKTFIKSYQKQKNNLNIRLQIQINIKYELKNEKK